LADATVGVTTMDAAASASREFLNIEILLEYAATLKGAAS
jgi:hypothetical protein